MRLLLIDDDVELSALIQEFFIQHEIQLETAHDGKHGLLRALESGFDLVLLDVMMPQQDGFEVLRQLRRRSNVPIIMLTARTDQADRVAGLNQGADDYLPKPFSPEELLARIQAVLRRAGRGSTFKADVLEANGVRMIPGTRETFCDGAKIDLTSIEFDILEILIRSAGRVVSRDDLSRTLYNRQATPFERSLDVHLSHLRRKLEHNRTLIRTVRGIGYLFCLTSEESAPL